MTIDESIKLKLLNEELEQCRKSPFYNKRLPDKPLSSISEIKKLPFTTKEDIRNNSPFGLLSVPVKELFQYHETFGTTGIPASTWLTREDFIDFVNRINEGEIDFTQEDIVLIRFPYAISSVAHFMHAAVQAKGACVIPASSRNTISPFTRVVSLLKKLNVTVLASLPLQAILLAETAQMLGLNPRNDFPDLRAIYNGGEALPPGKRKLIEELWNVPVYDNYGMTETGPIAVACKNGKLHPFESRFIIEVLDDDYKSEVGIGNVGNLVLTTLTRKAEPLVRYITGDRVRLVKSKCSCGAEVTIEVHGRQQDILKIKDRLIDIWDLDDIIYSLGNISFWVAGPVNDKLKIVAENENLNSNEVQKQFEFLQSKYGISIEVEYVPPGTLHDTNGLLMVGQVGKPKYIYSEEEMERKTYLDITKNL